MKIKNIILNLFRGSRSGKEKHTYKMDVFLELFGDSIKKCQDLPLFKALQMVQSNEYEWKSKICNLRLCFTTKEGYEQYYGPTAPLPNTDPKELVLQFLYLLDLPDYANLPFHVVLPFGIRHGMPNTEVKARIGKKPYDKYEIHLDRFGSKGLMEFYDCGKYVVELKYDSHLCATEISVLSFSKEKRSKIDFKNQLLLQKPNIKPENAALILAQLNEMPLWIAKDWENKRLTKVFSESLQSFVNNCEKYTRSQNPTAIMNAVKRLVEKVNDIVAEEYELIETMEREEICAFIDNTVKLTGLQFAENIDITEEWREW